MENESKEIYSIIIWQDYEGFNQVRLVINEFRGIEYLHIRKYYLTFDEEWAPGNEGISIPLEVESTRELFRGVSEIIALAESKDFIEEYFGEIIREVYCR